jgi:hypothetical protein
VASAHDTERVAAPDGEPLISHFIPSVELTGSPEDKLRKLDTLIVYLHQLRGRLAGDATIGPRNTTRLARLWSWFTAGFLVGAAGVLLLMTACRWRL